MTNKIKYVEFSLPEPISLYSIELIQDMSQNLTTIDGKLSEVQNRLNTIPKPESGSQQPKGISKTEAVAIASCIFDIDSTINIAKEEPKRFSSYGRTLSNQVKKTYELLKKQKIEVINHTGQKYYDTMKVEVLTWETSQDVEHPVVTDTIEPTIYYKGEMVKQGKVIVASK